MLEISVIICGVRVVMRTDDIRIFNLLAPSFADHHDNEQNINSEVTYWIVTSSSHIHHPVVRTLLDSQQPVLPDNESHIYKRISDGIFYKDKYASWYMQSGACYCVFNLNFWIESGYNYNEFFYLIFRTMFYEGLWQQSRFWLHAAAIQHHRFGPILLVGDRYHAKSTISIAFCDAGHQLLTDDTIFFTCDRQSVCEFRTLQRELHLDPELAMKIKTLSGIESRMPYADGETKVTVGLREFFPDAIINHITGAKVVIFPQIVESSLTRVVPLETIEVFWRLLCHSYTGLLDLNATITQSFLWGLQNIIKDSVSFALLCGTDCYKDPSLYVTTIETELENHFQR